MSDKKLAEFLVKLADDHKALSTFEKDPDAAMKAAGLSAAEISVIQTKDARKIQEAIIAEYPPHHPISTAARPKISLTITISITVSI